MSDDNAGRLTRLGEENEIAADYLEELLDVADLDGNIKIDVENDCASVEIIADDPDALNRLVGDDDEVLDTLQGLTRLAVQTETGERSHLILDIADFRTERKEELQDVTRKAIARVRTTGKAVKLDAMNPFERRVCHDVVTDGGLTSGPGGAEPHRRVVILSGSTDGE